MKVKVVEFTEEHLLFLWKRFRYILEKDMHWYFNIEKINTTGCCVEIRRSDGKLDACGVIVGNEMVHSAVHEDIRGNNIQVLLIKARIKWLKENTNFKTVEMCVRCKNVASWRNALKCGFKVVDQIRYENDDEGFLLVKNID